jgi:hypothetical protein
MATSWEPHFMILSGRLGVRFFGLPSYETKMANIKIPFCEWTVKVDNYLPCFGPSYRFEFVDTSLISF